MIIPQVMLLWKLKILAGNLHLNIVADQYLPEIQDALEPFVYEVVGTIHPLNHLSFLSTISDCCTAGYQGSISAEHGIGVMKTHALHYSKDAVSRDWMRKVKDLFDERGIMNPGKVLE